MINNDVVNGPEVILAYKKMLDDHIKFNYINKDNHLSIRIDLCPNCIASIKIQLQTGTVISLRLKLCLPNYYVSEISSSSAIDFNGSCSCSMYPKNYLKIVFASFKGTIHIIHRTGNIEPCNVTFHVTNSERKRLNNLFKLCNV